MYCLRELPFFYCQGLLDMLDATARFGDEIDHRKDGSVSCL